MRHLAQSEKSGFPSTTVDWSLTQKGLNIKLETIQRLNTSVILFKTKHFIIKLLAFENAGRLKLLLIVYLFVFIYFI